MSTPQSSPGMDTLEQYREVIEELDDILLILNEEGTIEYVNRALRKQLGTEKEWFTGKQVTDCLLPIGDIKPEDFLNHIKRERAFVTQLRVKSGEIKHFSWKTKPFRQQGEKKTLAIIRNITAEITLQQKTADYSRNLQKEVMKRHQQLEKEKHKAEELHQAKAIFLSKMSHELRTPLTAVCGYIELLQETGLGREERKKYLQVINRNARSLLEMINETLDMVKIEQKKFQVHPRWFRLPKLLKDLRETYEVLAEEKGVQLRVVTAESVPERIYSDPNAIRQILTNLVGNALKFTDQGSVTIRVKQRTFPHKVSQKLYFYVEDTGVGIPREYHRRIFKSFEQYLDNHVVHSRGSGLGLAISRQMARLLGGNVKLVGSQPQKGSTFMFSLPLQSPD